jgi:hypothetical protein
MALAHHPHWLSLRAFRLALLVTAIATVVAGPLVAANWSAHAAAHHRFGYTEVVNPRSASGAEAEAVREYLARRHPATDHLLPNGAGGTRFFVDLDGNAGMAFSNVPAIGVSVTASGSGWPETTELHERAHLLHAFLPGEVGALMAGLPPPASGEYAASSAREHFAEMASEAWQIVTTPDFLCVDGTPMERLHDAETRVPGSAGFVVWYVRHLSREDVEHYDELARMASSLAAPHRTAFDAVWQALEERRLPGGDFRPWERAATVRGQVERWRAELRASDRQFDRLGSYRLPDRQQREARDEHGHFDVLDHQHFARHLAPIELKPE